MSSNRFGRGALVFGKRRGEGRPKRLISMAAVAAVAAGLSAGVPAVAADRPEPVVQALWEFGGDAADSSGNGHNGTVGTGVTFTDFAAVFDGTNNGEITVPHDQALEPGSGKSWTLEVDGITPGALTGNYQTIVQSRDSDRRFWILYILPGGSIEFWEQHQPGTSQALKYASGVTAVAGSTYNVSVTWDSSGALSLDVTGAATASEQYSAGQHVTSAEGGPIRFGNGHNAGDQYFYRGSIERASITTKADLPPPPEDEMDVVASWLFDGDATDDSGNGHHGAASQGVGFQDGAAVFAGNSTTTITVPYDIAMEPIGRDWKLALDGITPGTLTRTHQAIVSSRTSNLGWVFYLMPDGTLSFWSRVEDQSGWQQWSSGVKAVPGSTYDVEVTWEDARGVTIEVSGAAEATVWFAETRAPLLIPPGGSPLRFGHGGDGGAEFYYRGSLGGARILVGESSGGAGNSLALGKGAAGFSDQDGTVLTQGSAATVTDGAKNNANSSFGVYGPSYTQVDLGAVHALNSVGLWRNWTDGRTHLNTVVVAADTLDGFKTGVGRTVLWNAATEAGFYAPSLGSLPAGSDLDYAETADGRTFEAPEGTRGRYVRVYSSGTDLAGSAAQVISQVVEIQVWGTGSIDRPTWQQGEDVIVPLQVSGKSASGLGPANAVDGNPDTYWESPASSSGFGHWRHFDIQLDGVYDLTQIKIANSNRGIASSKTASDAYGGGDYSHYQIYASQDGESFDKVAYKSDDAPATFEGDLYDLSGVEDAQGVSAVRVSVVYSSFQQAGRVYEVELRGAKVSSVAPVAPGVRVADFADTDWADEWDLVATDPEYAEEKLVAEMGNLVERVLGAEWRDSFVFVVEDVDLRGASQDKDAFSVSGSDGVITVKGRNGVSLASGLNHYLKNYAHVNYNPILGSNVEMPAVLPMPAAEVVKTTNYDVRDALNFCTWGYTMMGWGWEELEAFLDWSAMNGLNMIVDIVGQEEVIRRLFLEYGYSEAEIRDYITGPAWFPWYYMQNMTGFGGPLPDNWFDQRVETARQMHDRMQIFGIDPIIQGYSGMVPTNFASKNPDAQLISQGSWGGFARPSMLRTIVADGTEDYFAAMAPRFYEIQGEVFGEDVSHYYAVDPFHEGGQTGGMNMLDVYAKIQTLMTDWDEDAVWVIQQWQNNVTVEKLNGLDKEHVLVIDLNAVASPNNGAMESTGTPWVWNVLHTWGGRTGLHGLINQIAVTMPNRYKSANYMVGIGTVAEGFSNSGVIFDLLFDMTWESEPVTVADWISDYADSRYGSANADQEAAWQTLAQTILNNNPNEGRKWSVINQRPGFRGSDGGYTNTMEAAIPKLVEAYRAAVAAGGANEALTRDLAEVTIEMLQCEANTLMQRMQTAWNAKNQADWDRYSATFLEVIAAVEEIADTAESMRVGTWVDDARDMLPEMDDWTRDLFEFNARALITTWGDQNQSGLANYANRLWSGVTADLYLERWKVWVEEIDNAFATGQTTAHSINWFLTDWKWVNLKSDEGHGYASEPSGADLAGLAEAACDEFCTLAAVVDKSALQTAVGAARDRFEDDYTADSWDVLLQALAGADAVLGSSSATQSQVEAALAVLGEAVDALEPVGPDVSASVAFKCAAGRVYLAVTVVNDEDVEPVSLALSGPFGSKSFASVAPGRKATASFNTLTANLSQGGTLTLTAGAAGGGDPPVVSDVVYGTYSCGG